MSATQQLASMLDELMGRSRNALPTERQEERKFTDPDMCKYFLVDFCPHELFINTKADMGHCKRIHCERMKELYRQDSRFGKLGYEKEFYSCLRKLHNEMARKINRNRQRLELTQPGGSIANVNREKVEEKVKSLSDKVMALQEKAEALGNEGNVDEAQRLIKIAEDLAEERDRCRHTVEGVPGELKIMDVCDVCGCFLIIGDSQHRLDEHLVGKQHLGFAKVKETLDAYDKHFGSAATTTSRADSKSPSPDYDRRRYSRNRDSENRWSKGSRHRRSRSRSRSRHNDDAHDSRRYRGGQRDHESVGRHRSYDQSWSPNIERDRRRR